MQPVHLFKQPCSHNENRVPGPWTLVRGAVAATMSFPSGYVNSL